MPELPEVETVRQGLEPVLTGRRLTRAEARRPDLRVPLPQDFTERLQSQRVVHVGRRAKYLLIETENGPVLIAHLGMSGRMILGRCDDSPPFGKHDHVVFETDKGDRVIFNDPRRFGLMVFAEKDWIDRHPLIASIGPEPLANEFHGAMLFDRLKRRKSNMKAALLDQKLVAGLGNIYVAEALFRAGIHPKRSTSNVSKETAERLAGTIRKVLRDAIEAGGSSLKDYSRPDGELGYFQHTLHVYGREGEPCIKPGCGGTVRRIIQSGRSTFYCPRCQH